MSSQSAAPAREPEVSIRKATPADAENCAQILFNAFAKINRDHGFPPELPSAEAATEILRMLFSHSGYYGFVAEQAGRIVGSNCLDERSTISGLGPVSVDPATQNVGIGRALMKAALERARQQKAPGVRLVQSTFHNRSLSLYAKLGFAVREPLSVMHGKLESPPIESRTVRHAVIDDMLACNSLCRKIHGHDRAGELNDAVSHGNAVVVTHEGRITGYASGFGYFGHAVAESNEDLQALLLAAEHVNGPGILVPTRNAELFKWCLKNGLRVFQPMTLMTIGQYQVPGGAYLPSVLY